MTNIVHDSLKNRHSYKMGNSSITYYELMQNYRCGYKTKDRIQLIAVLWGKIEYLFGSESICQKNTEMMLLPFYSDLTVRAQKPTKMMVIEVCDELTKSVFSNIENKQPFNNAIYDPRPYVPIKYDSILYKSVQSIHSEYVENSENPYLVELNIRRLIYNLLKTEYSSYLFSIKAKHPMEQVKQYIARNVNRNIKISDLADLVGMHSSNFTNTFKRNFKMTPMNYIHEVKMKLAEQLLKENSVTEVAYELGFENVSSFISQFKKIYHITPKQYQIKNL
ncbi:helix-turn-helix transcriptional regulator [Clostridium sp. 'deep sea']|uniref:helix-turn-helix domain-containing protein n=1 Tax=Clostridium sp. 'deep sea' TaxID=2779445 RepID=UPI001896A0D2|nr:AraC family transcriptional regulator [Clostridium sp. 'deep sea']QOR36870.1 helix-turn-helix transcriptional regulator [Clostridium sp. 'deep sea']